MSNTTMSPEMVKALIELIIKYWNDDLGAKMIVEKMKEDEHDLYNAMFCERNEYIAAKVLFNISKM